MVALPVTPNVEEAVGIDGRLADTARRLNVDKVKQYRLNVHKMREEGVLIDLTIHGFTMFTVHVDWLELGIPAGDVRARRFTKGRKHLIPRSYIGKLDSFDSRIRRCFAKYSASITGFRPYRYFTYEAYAEWKAQMDGLQRELDALKDEIVEKYPQFRADLEEAFTAVAHRAWDSLVGAQGGDPERDALKLENGRGFAHREAFTRYILHGDGVVGGVLGKLPTPEKIKHDIRVVYQYSLMLSQSDIAQDEYIAEFWRARSAEQEAEVAYQNERAEGQRRVAREEEEAAKRVIEEREWGQRCLFRAEAEERELEVRERRIKLETLRELVEEEIRQQIADTIDPATELALKERVRLNEALAEVMHSIETNGYLHGGTTKKMRNLIERFRFFQTFDVEAAAEVDSLEAALERRIPHPDKRGKTTYDVYHIAKQVEQIIDFTADAARELGYDMGSTRAGALMV